MSKMALRPDHHVLDGDVGPADGDAVAAPEDAVVLHEDATGTVVDDDGPASVWPATGRGGPEVQQLLACRGRVVEVRRHATADRDPIAGLDIDGLLDAAEVGLGRLDPVVLDGDVAGGRGVSGAAGVLTLHAVAAVVTDGVLLDQHALGASEMFTPWLSSPAWWKLSAITLPSMVTSWPLT
jgi:hypothetical protein